MLFIPSTTIAPTASASSFTGTALCQRFPVRVNAHKPLFAPISCASNDDNTSNQRKKQADGPSLTISRRQAIQLLNGVLGAFTVTLLFKMKEQFRLMSPKTVMSAFGLSLLPKRSSAATPPASPSAEKLREATTYLRKVEARGPITCPDFPAGADWINSGPLSLRRQLSGKLVLMDFFTYCCVNCQHVLPKLAALEAKHGDDLVVVGVHSAKFSAERETANIAAAVDRYNVRHPVINDENMALWNGLGVSSWPTLALIGPQGKVIALWSGERQEEDIDTVITAALDYYSDSIDRRPLPAVPASASAAAIARSKSSAATASPLAYPGKLCLNSAADTLYVADSGNHRVLQIDAQSGNVRTVFGSGSSGLTDSTGFETASKCQFRSPQGVALDGGDTILFVADTENHAVRAIDLRSGAVVTIGGTGEQGFDYSAGKTGTQQALSSPWDVEVSGDSLYVAMAGIHQIWRLPLPQSQPLTLDTLAQARWEVFSGTGRELEKNALDGRAAGWAQPSHLSAADGVMYVADSESSSVRTVALSPPNGTRTVAGGDGLIPENLFAFGDREGRGNRAKFQHPLAVCAVGDKALVADSYNHRLKAVTADGAVANLCGSGAPGFRDGAFRDALFWEPAGLAATPDGTRIYVADTNNCAIRVVDMGAKKVSTLQLALSDASTNDKPAVSRLVPNRRRAVIIECEDAVVSSANFSFAINLPAQTHFTPGTTSRFQVNALAASDPIEKLAEGSITKKGTSGAFTVELSKVSIPVDVEAVEVEAVTYFCSDTDDVCRVESDIFTVRVAPNGKQSSTVTHNVIARKKGASSGTPV